MTVQSGGGHNNSHDATNGENVQMINMIVACPLMRDTWAALNHFDIWQMHPN